MMVIRLTARLRAQSLPLLAAILLAEATRIPDPAAFMESARKYLDDAASRVEVDGQGLDEPHKTVDVEAEYADWKLRWAEVLKQGEAASKALDEHTANLNAVADNLPTNTKAPSGSAQRPTPTPLPTPGPAPVLLTPAVGGVQPTAAPELSGSPSKAPATIADPFYSGTTTPDLLKLKMTSTTPFFPKTTPNPSFLKTTQHPSSSKMAPEPFVLKTTPQPLRATTAAQRPDAKPATTPSPLPAISQTPTPKPPAVTTAAVATTPTPKRGHTAQVPSDLTKKEPLDLINIVENQATRIQELEDELDDTKNKLAEAEKIPDNPKK
mmetsp:Transcript_89213/g.186447  ORF Transcript_89213/g.186447 Transcript_89213/m.186447 type:complete len:323 (-) Transcript_89213:38-1006(-)